MTDFHGSVTLLRERPSDERIAEIAAFVAETDLPEVDDYAYEVSENLPALSENVVEHFTGLHRSHPGSVFLLVYPANGKKTPTNGTIPR